MPSEPRCTRKELLALTLGAALGLPPLGEALCQRPGAGRPALYRWWPRFPVAKDLWVVPFAGDVEEGMLLESAAGLAARAALHGAWRSLIYEDVDNDGYRRWFQAYCRAHRPKVVRMSVDDAVRRLQRAGIVKGYVLYRNDTNNRPLHSPGPVDESANVANSLAGRLGGVLASERVAERLNRLGLRQLMDVRDKTEKWCLDTHGDGFSRSVVGTADPKTRNVRSLMIAMDAFVCSARGDPYRRALARCKPDSPVLGWGCEAEDAQTIPSSRAGLYQSATNWCHNLPVFAGEAPGSEVPAARLRQRHIVRWSDLNWGDGRHYASFVLSDGDNVQWLMGNFTGGPEARSYYRNPLRGKIPFGWGLPVSSLAQLSPRTLEEVLGAATPNDGFICYSGGGYFYPDLYGMDRGSREALQLHADRLRGYMDLTGIRILAFNFQKWDSLDAMAACETMARRLPGLLGILAFQYYPYSAGDGAIRWVRGAGDDEVPIVSCRLTIWAQTGRPHDTTPAGVAKWLGGLPVVGRTVSDNCFSWVICHAWSRFRHAERDAPLNAEEAGVSQDRDAPGTARGYQPAVWAAERLSPAVRLVTAQELLWRIRLRLRPRATLTHCLHEVEARPHSQSGKDLAQLRALLPKVDGDPAAARRAFEMLKGATRRRQGSE